MVHRKLDMLDRKLEAGIKLLDQKMDVLHQRIGNLLKVPFLTGVSIAKEVFELPCECNDGDQRRFREDRLKVAISELDQARSLLHEDFDTLGNHFIIEMIQALCATQIRGAIPYAQSKFRWLIDMLDQEIRDLGIETPLWEERERYAKQESDRIVSEVEEAVTAERESFRRLTTEVSNGNIEIEQLCKSMIDLSISVFDPLYIAREK